MAITTLERKYAKFSLILQYGYSPRISLADVKDGIELGRRVLLFIAMLLCALHIRRYWLEVYLL